jgi:RNA-binding protein YlmH
MKIDYTVVRDEKEKHFLKMLQSYSVLSQKQQKNLFTPFYSIEWMKETIQRYIKGYPLDQITFFGGYPYAERQLAGFTLSDLVEEEIPITLLEIVVKTGMGKPLTHRDFLGAILGLGIDRSKIGDIILTETGAYVIVDREMGSYIRWSLEAIGRYSKISIEDKPFEVMQAVVPQTKQIEVTVASLRADAIFAAAFKLSRATAAKLLQAERGRCNGVVVKSQTLFKEGDVGSLKGYGKIKLSSINGKTKKERVHVTIDKYI